MWVTVEAPRRTKNDIRRPFKEVSAARYVVKLIKIFAGADLNRLYINRFLSKLKTLSCLVP
jgi:hypothetical protein